MPYLELPYLDDLTTLRDSASSPLYPLQPAPVFSLWARLFAALGKLQFAQHRWNHLCHPGRGTGKL